MKRILTALQRREKERLEFSKRLIRDIRGLLWVVTIGGLALSLYCIRTGYTGGLPWLTAMVGLPWTAHGAVCSAYIHMARADHREGGITFEAARAHGFKHPDNASPPI